MSLCWAKLMCLWFHASYLTSRYESGIQVYFPNCGIIPFPKISQLCWEWKHEHVIHLWKRHKVCSAHAELHTGPLCPCLFGWLAGLASPDGVACQDPKLIFHPRAQVYYCSCQPVAPHHLRNWNNTHSGPFCIKKLCMCVCLCIRVCVCQLSISSRLSSRLTGLVWLHHRYIL